MELVWDELQIKATNDERIIKKAYAKRLKQTRPDEQPDAFQRLRKAYEIALDYSRTCSEAQDSISQPDQLSGVDLCGHDERLQDIETHQNPHQKPVKHNPEDEIQIQIEQYMEELFHCFKEHGDTKAAELLEQITASDALINIEARHFLETMILNALNGLEYPPLMLLEKASKIFHWSDSDHQLRAWYGQIHQYAIRAHQSIEVRKTLEGYINDGNWRNLSNQTWLRHRKAARLLLRDWDHGYFEQQARKPVVVDALKELMGFIQGKYGSSYQMCLDARVVEYWERVVKTPSLSLWWRIVLYLSACTGSYVLLDLISIQSIFEPRHRDTLKHALVFSSVLTAIPFFYVARSLIHNILYQFGSIVEQTKRFNRFLRHDTRITTIFGVATLCIPLIGFQVPDDTAIWLVLAEYLMVIYWLRSHTIIVWIFLMALFLHLPTSVLMKYNHLGYLSPQKAHLITLSVSFVLIGGYLWLCRHYKWRVFAMSYSIAFVVTVLVMVGNIEQRNKSLNQNMANSIMSEIKTTNSTSNTRIPSSPSKMSQSYNYTSQLSNKPFALVPEDYMKNSEEYPKRQAAPMQITNLADLNINTPTKDKSNYRGARTATQSNYYDQRYSSTSRYQRRQTFGDKLNSIWRSGGQDNDSVTELSKKLRKKQLNLPLERRVLSLSSSETNTSYMRFYKQWVESINLCVTLTMPSNLPTTIDKYLGIALVRVDLNGEIRKAEIRKSSTSRIMDAHVLRSIRDCKIIPEFPKYITQDFHQADILFSYKYEVVRAKDRSGLDK